MFILDAAYLTLLVLISPWLLVMFLTRPAVRAGFRARLAPQAKVDPTARTLWLHGASAGEIGLLRPLVKMIESDSNDRRIVISAYAISGYDAARRHFPEHTVIYFPADVSFVIRRFLRAFNPYLVVLVEAELWPNFLATTARAGIPVCAVNARMSQKSFRIHRRTGLIPWAARKLSWLAVQSEEDAQRFRELGIAEDRLHVTGNMKYDLIDTSDLDRVPEIRSKLREQYDIGDDVAVFIAGSVHREEDEAVAWAFSELLKTGHRVRMVLVPRYPADGQTMAGVLESHGLEVMLKTVLDERKERLPDDLSTVLVVDTMGELKQFYAMSDIAYVGGSLTYRGSNKGGHNMMEPAIMGLAVMFGPFNYSFREAAKDLRESAAGTLVRDRNEIYSALQRLLDDPAYASSIGDRAREVVIRNRGATGKNFELLRSQMS